MQPELYIIGCRQIDNKLESILEEKGFVIEKQLKWRPIPELRCYFNGEPEQLKEAIEYLKGLEQIVYLEKDKEFHSSSFFSSSSSSGS
ncbi:MAG: hypothetical protein V1837_00095 [Candidatus Woesearchaeota archaeon]